ncbi:Ssh4p [Saccharomyces cerevisiae YJM189]|nr:Ssh4p [Saccharomyces cerevisiae YJM189]
MYVTFNEALDSSFGNLESPNHDFKVGDPNMVPTPPMDSDSAAISLAFLISLSITFAILMLILVVIAAYVTFCGDDESEYDEENALGTRTSGTLHSLFGKKHSGILLDSSFASPGGFDDEIVLQERELEELPKMSAYEVELYIRAKEFQMMSPPMVKDFGTYLDSDDQQFIKDRGIQSYFLLPSINDNIDEYGNFLPSFIVQDKLDIQFSKFNKSSSTVMNYPLPHNRKDAVYFEVKIFRHIQKSNSIFSIGLTTVPYPYFRVPGMAKYSIAYESTGKLRINNPFTASTLLPKLEDGDTVGFGYRYKTGTIFITHNGKKLMDVTQNIGIDLFIGIGAFNAAYTRTYTRDGLLEDPDNVSFREALSEGKDIEVAKDLQRVHDPHDESDEMTSDEVELHVNLGQVGFVFIEANVKKYAFGSVYGQIGIPPAYNGTEIKKDTILQKGEELPPRYADTDNFFGSMKVKEGTSSRITAQTSKPLWSVGTYERISSNFDRENNVYHDSLETDDNNTDNNVNNNDENAGCNENSPLLEDDSNKRPENSNTPREVSDGAINKNPRNKSTKKRQRNRGKSSKKKNRSRK